MRRRLCSIHCCTFEFYNICRYYLFKKVREIKIYNEKRDNVVGYNQQELRIELVLEVNKMEKSGLMDGFPGWLLIGATYQHEQCGEGGHCMWDGEGWKVTMWVWYRGIGVKDAGKV